VMRKIVMAAVTLAGATVAGVAQAAPDGLYAGAGITHSQVDDIFGPDSDLRIRDTSWKAFMGFKFPLFPIGIEAEYADFGSNTHNFGFIQGHADAKAFSAFAVGWLPIPVPNLDLFGKLGAARWQLDGGTVRPSLFELDDRGTQFAWGVGAQVHWLNVAVRLEYEGFDVRNTSGARLYSLGAAYYFL
jgi:hypothetical protein